MSVISSISLSGNLFINFTQDNRLRLWDTNLCQEKRSYVEKNHLLHTYVCSAWRQSTEVELGLFAVGASDGSIVIWDLSRGIALSTISTSKDSPASGIAFAVDGQSIYASSNSSEIIEYDIKSGLKKSGLMTGMKSCLRICISPVADILAVSRMSIRLLDIKSGRKRKLKASFPGDIACINFTQCGKYLTCSGTSSKEILVFNVQMEALNDSLICTVPLPGIPQHLHSISVTVADKIFIDTLVVFEDGTGGIIRNDLERGFTLCTLVTSSSSPLLNGKLLSSSGVVMLVLGNISKPRFVRLAYHSEDGSLAKSLNVEIETVQNNSTATDVTANDFATAAPTVLGPNEMGAVKRPLVDIESINKRQKLIDVVEDIDEAGQLELEPLEVRLERLSADLALKEQDAASKDGVVEATGPSADSLVVLIEQAIQSSDNSLLEHCLSVKDAHVVEATARKLPSGRVLLLLRSLVAKFEKRPTRGLLLARWLSALLRHHTSFLIAVPDLARQISGLGQMLEQRLSSYTRLASLAGRLDVLMSQVSYASNSNSENEISNPQQTYVDE